MSDVVTSAAADFNKMLSSSQWSTSWKEERAVCCRLHFTDRLYFRQIVEMSRALCSSVELADDDMQAHSSTDLSCNFTQLISKEVSETISQLQLAWRSVQLLCDTPHGTLIARDLVQSML